MPFLDAKTRCGGATTLLFYRQNDPKTAPDILEEPRFCERVCGHTEYCAITTAEGTFMFIPNNKDLK